MTRLTIHHADGSGVLAGPLIDHAEIACHLKALGVRFERWPTRALAADATQEQILAAYEPEIARLKREGGYRSADVVRLTPETPNAAEMRRKFLAEHAHAEDEVRFFVEGSGAFYLREEGEVLQLVCERGDLLSVPAGQRHWFDMGPRPRFTAVRLFTNPEGWVARFTGDDIATRIPLYEAAAA